MANIYSFYPSGARFHVAYGLRGPESLARSKAQSICFEQTVEAVEHSIPEGVIREHLVGRVKDFTAVGAESYRTTISYLCELLTGDFISQLNVMYGIASLSFLTQWRGARFGSEGLRCPEPVAHANRDSKVNSRTGGFCELIRGSHVTSEGEA